MSEAIEITKRSVGRPKGRLNTNKPLPIVLPDDPAPLRFGKNLLHARHRLGLTQEQVAKAARVDEDMVYAVETGRDIRLSSASKLAAAVHLTISDLLD